LHGVPEPYIRRTLEAVVRRAAREFPAVVVTGPRQSGKTTLLRRLFPRWRHVSLEPPDVRAAAAVDPRGFVDAYPPPVVFDEVQYVPDLLPYVKERIDARRDLAGQYALTGSQHLLLVERVTESLAGRAAILRLFPLSEREIAAEPAASLPWEPGRHRRSVYRSGPVLWSQLVRGSFPEIVANPRRDAALWQASYVQTYLERDVRTLRQIGDLTQFQAFLRLLAIRSASLLDLSDLSRDLGIAPNTVKAWLSVLEATHQVMIVRPYFANIGKRLVKMPKVYFTDTGLLCWLSGVRDPEHAAAGPMGGTLFETAVFGELLKALVHRGQEPRISFWRTSAGVEVDFIVETREGLVPIEAKSAATPNPRMAAGIQSFRHDLGEAARPGFVVHPGTVSLPLGQGCTALPFGAL
jgi:predicted AAA+ superfamily ATPase